MNNWLDNIQSKVDRYNELDQLLANPEVCGNSELFKKYAKERSSLIAIAEKFALYTKTADLIHDTKEMISSESDPDLIKMATAELEHLEEELNRSKEDLEDLILAKENDFDKDVIVEIRAGTGGIEATLFASDLHRMYTKYATEENWNTEMLSTNTTGQGGYKEVIFSISGSNVYGKMRFESGTHRVQRVPVTETSGRIHTSAVTVAVLPEAEEIDFEIKQDEIRIDVYRSSGKGGQGVNTTDSAVRITHLPSGTVVTCQDERSQLKNKTKAMRVLRTRLADMYQAEQASKLSNDRKLQVGSGDRSEKIRTYNFPEKRVTDHRINLTVHKLDEVLEGKINVFIDALSLEDKTNRLKNI